MKEAHGIILTILFERNEQINTKRIPPKAVSIIGQMPLKTMNVKLKFLTSFLYNISKQEFVLQLHQLSLV